MEFYYKGVLIAISTFIIIGVFHPIVIKVEYYFGTKLWWLFLVTGILSVCAALFIEDVFISSLFGVLGASLLWSIGEIFDQKKRVEKTSILFVKRTKKRINNHINNIVL